MIEKRDATRVPFRCEIDCEEVESGTRPPNALIADVSTTGLFVDTTVVFSQGAIVNLCFKVPSLVLRVTARVAHSMPGMGMGLRFLDLTPAQRTAIEEIVKAVEADQDPTTAEFTSPGSAADADTVAVKAAVA